MKSNCYRFTRRGTLRSCIVVILFSLLILSALQAQSADKKTNIGLAMSAVKMIGGTNDASMISPWLNVNCGYGFTEKLWLELNGGFGWDRAPDNTKDAPLKYFHRRKNISVRTLQYPITANLKYKFKPEKTHTPYLLVGAGVLFWDLIDVSGGDHFFTGLRFGHSVYGMKMNALLNLGVGCECFIKDKIALDWSLRYQQLFDRDLDMTGYNDINTGNIECRLGLTYYFGGSKDSDKDGIPNDIDRCRNEAEDMDGFQDDDGCPDPDNDEDGILDADDQSPNEAEDKDGFQDDDGIPDPDNDQDGVLDVDDKAPDEAEDMDGFQDEDGMPDMDNDGDGIPDDEDQCPDEPETINEIDDEDGCPDDAMGMLIPEEESMVLQGINFGTGSVKLTEIAKETLGQVFEALKYEADMNVEVRGYTDSIGRKSLNLKLSQRRADAVKDYLVNRGISVPRIVSKGYGEDSPIATNDTKEGRSMNRRIEFKRLD